MLVGIFRVLIEHGADCRLCDHCSTTASTLAERSNGVICSPQEGTSGDIMGANDNHEMQTRSSSPGTAGTNETELASAMFCRV